MQLKTDIEGSVSQMVQTGTHNLQCATLGPDDTKFYLLATQLIDAASKILGEFEAEQRDLQLQS